MQWSSRVMLRLLIVNILDREEKIMDEQITTLASLTIDGKGSYGIGASAVPFSKDLYTYLRITDIKDDGTLNLQDLKSVDDEKASEYLLKPNDIVFARTGASTGRNYFYDGTDGEFVYAGFLIKFSIDKKKVNPKYIKYFCQSKQYKDWINSFNTGSTRGNINAQTLGKMPIPLIERKTQDALVCILSSIDEKIKKNNEINNNLQQQIQTLFADWILTNRQSATEVALSEVCIKVTDGSHFSPKDDPASSIPMLSVKDMREFDFDFTSCKHICEEDYEKMVANDCVPQVNDILVAKDGSYLKEIFICNEQRKIAILSSIAIFRPDTTIIHPEILLAFFKSPHVLREVRDNYVSGSALPRIVLKDFKKLTFALPNMDVQNQIAPLFASVREQIAVNVAENKYLAQLRDTLLSKLMSGEISVDSIRL